MQFSQIVNSTHLYKYSKQYNRIQLYSLIFYFKYKNYNKLLIEFNHI